MKTDFDRLLESSGRDMPDPGPYRRMNRAALLQRIERSRQKARRRRFLAVVTACMAILVLIGGRTNQLVSDDWQLDQGIGEAVGGDATNLYTDPSGTFSIVGDLSAEEAQDLQQVFMARDAIPYKVTCLAYGGGEDWSVFGMAEIGGVMQETLMDTRGILPGDDLPNLEEFYLRHFEEIINLAKTPPTGNTYRMTVFGVVFEVQSWSQTYPGYGEVTYSVGSPI